MGQMFDAVDPDNIPATCDGRPALRITVLANPAGQAFDVEGGNAPAAEVAAAMAVRESEGHWSVAYVNESTIDGLEAAMGPKGLRWAEGGSWPAPGVYLWAADPSGNIVAGRWSVPVAPLAIQHLLQASYDVSTTVTNFPAAAAGYIDGPKSIWPANAWARFTALADGPVPAPKPTPSPTPAPAPAPEPSEVTVLLPVLQQGMTAPSVRAVQVLVGGINVDGIFGPVTHARIVEFQATHGLARDGVVGQHTWGALLGAPQ
jgi:peptidoglycan hydrolase-like protein with peptidoglycan-binding domain